MTSSNAPDLLLPPETQAVYCRAMAALADAGVGFLVGGAYAFERYTGIARHTKDFDVFVHPRDYDLALDALAQAGYRTERTFPHWLGKAVMGDDFVDVIFGSGNGIAVVDDEWFAHAVDAEVLGVPARLCPAEEIIWSKAFIMERERYDGADVAHILHASAERLDWRRLLWRFGPHWRVLFQHLILFGFVYPADRHRIPGSVMRCLTRRLDQELLTPPPPDRLCQGTLLSRAQYLVDVGCRDYLDARLTPYGPLSEEEAAIWTAAIADDLAAAQAAPVASPVRETS
jgi:hypothetical protein